MTLRIRCPQDTKVPVRFFARFTVLDLVRIGAPTAIGAVVAGIWNQSVLGAVLGLVIGIVWYAVRPYGLPLDRHGYHLLRFVAATASGVKRPSIEYHEGYVVTETGRATAVVQVTPATLALKRAEETAALHDTYRELLGSASFPVRIHSHQRPWSLQDYAADLDEIATTPFAEEYATYCREFEQTTLHTTDHFVLIQVGADEYDGTPADELVSRCRFVVDTLSTDDIEATRLTGPHLREAVEALAGDVTSLAPFHSVVQHSATGIEEYRRVVEITELPSEAEFAWPRHVQAVDGDVDVVQVVEPEPVGDTTTTLNRRSERLAAEIDSVLMAGYHGTNQLAAKLDDAEWLLDLLATRADRPVTYRAYIVVRGESKSVCDRVFRRVCTQLDAQRIQYRIPVFRSDHAHRTISPLTSDGFTTGVLMPGRSAAAGFPFATHGRHDRAGVIYGVDTADETPILLDRYAWRSHSMVYMGATGSGKSYAVKQGLTRSAYVYENLHIRILDPKREYGELVEALGGTVHTINEATEINDHLGEIACIQPAESIGDTTALLTDVVKVLYEHATATPQPTLVVVDEAHRLLNREAGRDVLSVFVREARSSNTAVTLVTQNASDFTHYKEGRDLLDNVPAKVFLKHERVPDSVVSYFGLSARERKALHGLKTGTSRPYSEAVIKVGGRLDARIRIEAAGPAEHGLCADDASGSDVAPISSALSASNGGDVFSRENRVSGADGERGDEDASGESSAGPDEAPSPIPRGNPVAFVSNLVSKALTRIPTHETVAGDTAELESNTETTSPALSPEYDDGYETDEKLPEPDPRQAAIRPSIVQERDSEPVSLQLPNLPEGWVYEGTKKGTFGTAIEELGGRYVSPTGGSYLVNISRWDTEELAKRAEQTLSDRPLNPVWIRRGTVLYVVTRPVTRPRNATREAKTLLRAIPGLDHGPVKQVQGVTWK